MEVNVSISCAAWRSEVADAADWCRDVAAAALASAAADRLPAPLELAIVLADDAKVRELNGRFRGQDRATNVLSFPATGADDRARLPPGAPEILGDVVVAYETARAEAAEQGKGLRDHLAHLLVHGVLHLLGYDHEAAPEAARMESKEAAILAGMGVADPYEPRETLAV